MPQLREDKINAKIHSTNVTIPNCKETQANIVGQSGNNQVTNIISKNCNIQQVKHARII